MIDYEKFYHWPLCSFTLSHVAHQFTLAVKFQLGNLKYSRASRIRLNREVEQFG